MPNPDCRKTAAGISTLKFQTSFLSLLYRYQCIQVVCFINSLLKCIYSFHMTPVVYMKFALEVVHVLLTRAPRVFQGHFLAIFTHFVERISTSIPSTSRFNLLQMNYLIPCKLINVWSSIYTCSSVARVLRKPAVNLPCTLLKKTMKQLYLHWRL